jgi:glycosyltransferase involved in cell wall biosynthesis
VTAVYVVVPEAIHAPARPSGGNTYDRHVCRGLAGLGWSVHRADGIQRIPDGATVLVDGLVASEVLVPHGSRLRLVVLVHMPRGDEGERAVLEAAAAVITTSAWARERLIGAHALPADRVHVAEPGVEAAGLAPGTAAGGELLCVANVIPGKGHDVLLAALTTIDDLAWHCACVGSLERDLAFVQRLRHDRVDFLGPRTGAELDRCYATADLLVLATRGESYGMVITEALARGLPVVVSDVGGVREALGDGLPGILVPREDPAALGAALRSWLGDADLRSRLRAAARERRATVTPWSTTASRVADVLTAASL